uniref:Kinesin motor domain-containing protein n=1 Tax=Globisporangium ultimum (strain ATCC 200006 / CBS 805.95 / DAOM BR144) TaxID=431595 RepID=K3WG29_GLOUD
MSMSMSSGSGLAPGGAASPTAAIESHVQVAVRCRPLNEREKASGRPPIVQCKTNTNEIVVTKRKNYSFDKVYGQYSTQKDVFKATVRPVVDEALAGYNCTVFAYGQTGTGKTHTMQGNLSPDDDMAGIIPRCVRYIFDALQSMSQEYSVKVSFLQLYNEELKDLLAPESKKLRLMEDPKRGGIYCQNLLEVTTNTAGHVFELLEAGVKNRITSETLMNENSSRSHSIFTIRIHSKENNAGGEDLIKTGQLNLVDLAGSECVGRSGARNVRAREAGNINQSLLTLGRVITALVDNHPHIPYRDSKLTRLLQESLGGRTKTTIIATLAPCADSIDETLSTLEYAHRAKNIKNKPEVNQKTTKAGLLKEYGNEIETLRNALQAARTKDGIYLPPAQFAEMQERIAGQAAQLAELEDELEVRNKACKELEDEVHQQKEEMKELERAKQEAEAKLLEVQTELASTKDVLQKTTAKLEKTKAELFAYQENEKVLLTNGERATVLFKESEARAALLLEKIERKRRVAESNDNLATSYSDKSFSQITEFQERLQHHHEEQDAFMVDVSKSIEQLQSAHSADLEKLTKSLDDLQALLTDRRNQHEAEIAKEQTTNELISTKLESSISDMDAAMQKELSSLVEMSKTHAANIAKELASANQRNMKSLEDVEAKLSSSRAEMTQFLSEQSQKLLELQATIDASIHKQSNQVEVNKESLVVALKEAHAKQQHELNEMKKHLTEYVDKCVATQAEKLQEQTSFIEKNATEQQKQLENETDSTQLQKQVAGMRSEVNMLASRHDELIKSQLGEQTKSIQNTVNMETAATKHLSELLSEQQQASRSAVEKRKTSTNAFMGAHGELHTVVSEATKDSTQQRHDLEVYLKKRKMDKETGSTPKKKTYSFPSFQPTRIATESATELSALAEKLQEDRQRASSTASKASTASTSSVDLDENEDPASSNDGEKGLSENETKATSSSLPGITVSKITPKSNSGMPNVSTLKPTVSIGERKLNKFGGSSKPSIQAPKRFR